MRGVVVMAALAGVCTPQMIYAFEITNVFADPPAFDPRKGQSTTIHFRLSDPAPVELSIYDGRNVRVASVPSKGLLGKGDRTLVWDGTDVRGTPAPPEAYNYVLSAQPKGADPVVWDITDATGGNRLNPGEAVWNLDEGVLRYSLAQAARVRIRIGLKNGGPLLRTVVDWVPRPPGAHAEAWDGWDRERTIDLSKHPNLALRLDAYGLPRNTLHIGPLPDSVQLISGLPEPVVRREVATRSPKRMYDYARQRIEERHDFPARLKLPENLPRDDAGLPIVAGPVPLQLDVQPEDRSRLIDERFEAVFFLDGQFLFENEVGFLPMTWTWDPAGANPGVHYLTANLRGYEGHFGMTTVKLVVSPIASSTATPNDPLASNAARGTER